MRVGDFQGDGETLWNLKVLHELPSKQEPQRWGEVQGHRVLLRPPGTCSWDILLQGSPSEILQLHSRLPVSLYQPDGWNQLTFILDDTLSLATVWILRKQSSPVPHHSSVGELHLGSCSTRVESDFKNTGTDSRLGVSVAWSEQRLASTPPHHISKLFKALHQMTQ